MVDTRESRSSATERKFVLEASVGALVREWARARLEPDPHGSGPFDDEYHTSSLYFDTDRLDVFHRRGSFGRAKYRIRRYSGASYSFIERKLRRPQLLIKRRTRVGLETVAALESGELGDDSPARWFHKRLRARRLVPTCLLSYHRTARVAGTPGGLARLTVDDGLYVQPASTYALVDARLGGERILPDQVILELKYRGALPDIFRELILTFGLTWQSTSKYRLGMMALGHRPDAREPHEPDELVLEN